MNFRKKRIAVWLGLFIVMASTAVYIYFGFPNLRAPMTAELIMLGDLNEDQQWTIEDENILRQFVSEPFSFSDLLAAKMDLNHNDRIDEEDISLLQILYRYKDPYLAFQSATSSGSVFPRPRELFRYFPKYQYLQRPIFTLPDRIRSDSPIAFLNKLKPKAETGSYQNALISEIYSEGLRFDHSYQKRKNSLHSVEVEYLKTKTDLCQSLYNSGQFFELLLETINLVEDAETLSYLKQSPFIQKLLIFRNHLRDVLESPQFKSFKGGQSGANAILNLISQSLRSDLGIEVSLQEMAPPRDLLKLENYVDRTKWQYYKSSASKSDFERLAIFAQYDRRYLRAVSLTSSRHMDVRVQNHNLPMILLFREALKIMKGDKFAAVGLLDEAIRVPFAWIKSIPRKLLPSSIASENFLLPGNKEDGSDKSRHWNVFGGLALYKAPEESLKLALAREVQDIKKDHYSAEGLKEFIRDTIANIHGIYYVYSMSATI